MVNHAPDAACSAPRRWRRRHPLARAQAAPALKIGVLTDMSGPYKDLAGPVAVQCVNQALEDFGVAARA